MIRTLIISTFLTMTACVVHTQPHGEANGDRQQGIISPSSGERVVSDTLTLKAQSSPSTAVNVAVRTTTEGDNDCSRAGESQVYRDVTGELSTNANGIYSDTIDVSDVEDGLYCFAFDPADSPRVSVTFNLATPHERDDAP